MNRPAALYDNLLLFSASKDQINKALPQKEPIDAPDADGDEEFFETINLAYQFLTHDAAREAYKTVGLDEPENSYERQKLVIKLSI